MHCNRKTAETIIKQGGDYVLTLKGNQNLTHNEIAACQDACVTNPEIAADNTTAFEKNRGRIETRTCRKAPNLDRFESRREWASLVSAYAIERNITAKQKKTGETTY
jgi:predicted transposase YbfD/YdcC